MDEGRFAAEVFRDLHKELTVVGGRAYDLTVRVQQLEAELPAVEKALLSEPNQLRFAYTNGTNASNSKFQRNDFCGSKCSFTIYFSLSIRFASVGKV